MRIYNFKFFLFEVLEWIGLRRERCWFYMYDEKYGVSLLCVLVFCDLFLLDYVNGMVDWLMWFNFYKLMLWVCVYY